MNPSGQERISLYVGSMEGGEGCEWRCDAVINGHGSERVYLPDGRKCVNNTHNCNCLPFGLFLKIQCTKTWIYFVESRDDKWWYT